VVQVIRLGMPAGREIRRQRTVDESANGHSVRPAGVRPGSTATPAVTRSCCPWGETASASLAFTTGSAEGAVDAAYLVVTPPNDYDHMVIGPFSRSMEFPIYHGDL
jgi:hypothetical protein